MVAGAGDPEPPGENDVTAWLLCPVGATILLVASWDDSDDDGMTAVGAVNACGGSVRVGTGGGSSFKP
jgi:hypothetical protein